MRRTTTAAIAAVVLGAAGSAAWVGSVRAASLSTMSTTAPTTMASTRPSNRDYGRGGRGSRGGRSDRSAPTPAQSPAVAGPNTTPKPMPSAFDALLTRSIFVKGSQTISDGRRAETPRNSDRGTTPVVRPEQMLVFNGVTLDAEEADAMIEDVSSHRISIVRPGDAIANGRVGTISFEEMTYVSGGRTTRVSIGQNLDGANPDLGSSAVASVPGAGPTTGPSGGSAAPSGLSPEDILARMKKKRQQEMGGK